jgi:hypothetical protein
MAMVPRSHETRQAMKYSELTLPIPYHETFDVLDSSKIQTFLDSPRKYFFNYLLGWQPEEPNIHFAFGSAWHEAMEYLALQMDGTRQGYTQDMVVAAYKLFHDLFSEEYQDVIIPGITLGGAPNKTLDNALNALIQYAEFYKWDKFKTLYTEVSGTVPISPERLIHFKLDTIVEDYDGIWSLEHKTSSRNTAAWRDKWSLMPQIHTYTHALRTLFPEEMVGVKINGAVLRAPTKTNPLNNEFVRIPIRKSNAMMVGWVSQINHWWDQVDWNMHQLSQHSASDEALNCFPCNPISCMKFGCSYSELCSVWPNPLQHADHPPVGFRKEHWDPRRDQSRAKNVVHLEQSTIIQPLTS